MSAIASTDRAGAVLVVVVLIVLALFGLAHGTLLAARMQLRVSAASAAQLEARAAAHALLAVDSVAKGGAWMDAVEVWDASARGTRTTPRVDARVTMRRLADESWLVEASARHENGAVAGVARLVWAPDPWSRIAASSAVVGVGPAAVSSVEGAISLDRLWSVDAPLTSADCAATDLVGARSAGWSRTEVVADTSLAPVTGLIPFDRLIRLGAALTDSVVAPGPSTTAGVCHIGDPSNLGDPLRPRGPCGSHVPVRSRAGQLRLAAGVGQGVLVVDGDLVIGEGARYHGLVWVSGTLRVERGGTLTGLAHAVGGVRVQAGADVVGSACWAARALSALRELPGGTVVLSEPIGPF